MIINLYLLIAGKKNTVKNSIKYFQLESWTCYAYYFPVIYFSRQK